MNLPKLVIAILVSLASLMPVAASACDANFTLYNHAAVPVERLYVSPSDRHGWYGDVLGANTIGSWESYFVDIDALWTYNGTFDIRADFANGAQREVYDVPLCGSSTVVVNGDGSFTY
jgi:hypothetical protein